MGERSIELDTALVKLARALDVDVSEVECFADLGTDAVRDLHWHVVDELGANDRRRLQGVASASKLVPTALAATIGEKWFGPVLCARLVDLVEPNRAGQFARHLSDDFMADITARTDPRGVGDLVEHLDLDTMQAIACALVERDDHLTLSHFVGHLPAGVVASILAAVDDDAAVVRIARFVDDLDHLDPIVTLLPDDRIVSLVRAVADQDLWVSGLHLFSHLGDAQVTRIASTIVSQDRDAVVAALEAFGRHDLWRQGLVLVDRLDADEIIPLADALLALDDQAIDAAIDAIDDLDAWSSLIRIGVAADGLDAEVARRLATVVGQLDDDRLDRLRSAADATSSPGLVERLLAAPAAG